MKQTTVRTSSELVDVSVAAANSSEAGQVLHTTQEHPFWVEGKGWKAAGTLTAGEELRAHGSGHLVVTELGRQPGVGTVYNFEVEGNHSYFVGTVQALVHNICGAPADGAITEIVVSSERHPEAAAHISDAQAAGHPSELTIDRAGATSNRAASTGGLPKVEGKHLDEYPPAMFKEGGKGASVRPINARQNMGSGACIGNACRGIPDGTKVRIVVR